MDEQERSEKDEPRDGEPETVSEGSPAEDEGGIDAAKLSDEEATLAARAFLGTAEPEEEVSVDEAKSVLRRAGASRRPSPRPRRRSPSLNGHQLRHRPPSRLPTPVDAGTSSTPTPGTRTK